MPDPDSDEATGDDACRGAGHLVQRGLPGDENAGARSLYHPTSFVAHQPLREVAGVRSFEVVHGRRHGPRDLHVLRRLQRHHLERVGWLADDAKRAASADPYQCFSDPAGLLLVHRFLRIEHLALKKTGARNRFSVRIRIKLDLADRCFGIPGRGYCTSHLS